MRIRGNWTALLSWRAFQKADQQITSSQARLSSGFRLNSASDDVAGLGISQKLLGQVNGLIQASRNAVNGLSLVNTAEGTLQEVHDLLHRARELSVQAGNGTLSDQNKQSLQSETSQILAEIDRIIDSTSFNGQSLFNPSGMASSLAATIDGLRNGWLERAEEIIRTYLGISGDGSQISIVFENSGATSAWVDGNSIPGGVLEDIELHINLADFGSIGGPDGGSGPLYNDRKIARALTEVILARNSDYASLPEWFVSGLGEYIAGGDEILLDAVNEYGAAAVVNAISLPWAEDNLHRASAYLAIKYLDSLLLPPFDMASVMQELTLTNDLSMALMNTAGPDVLTFVNDFLLFGEGFLSGLNLTDSEVGGIGGGNSSTVIPNGGTYSLNPLSHFSISWPPLATTTTDITLHVGANEKDILQISIPEVTRMALGLLGVDLVNSSTRAIELFGTAIDTVSSVRAYLGSIANRLEHTVVSNDSGSEYQLGSYSRIVDLDFANEMMSLVRGQILVSASAAMVAQANSARQHVMWLLKELRFPESGNSPLLGKTVNMASLSTG